MKKTAFLCWIKPVLILSFVCFFAFTATAQNYYPADIGNMWVFDSSDGEAQTTYTLEGPEIIDGQEYILLKISTEELSTGELDTDTYFLTVGSEAINLHRIVLETKDPAAVLTADFPTPATFFPLQLAIGDQWQIVADAEAKLEIGLTLLGKSITDFEVIGFEDVVTPIGTFQDCAKVRLDLQLTAGGFLNLGSTTYQWFAPGVGPIQYENTDGLLFNLTNSNVLTVPEEPVIPEEDTIPESTIEEDNMIEEDTAPKPVPYDVTGDGIVNILDLTFVAARFGEPDTDADVTGDSTVNILDLVLIAQNFSN